MKRADPSRMSATDRVAELGEILAAGIQRLLARGIKVAGQPKNHADPLDVLGQVEAQCASAMESHA